MWIELLPWAQEAVADPPTLVAQLAPWGVLSAAVSVFALMWRSTERSKQETVAAERRRADDWRSAAQLATERADERDRQLWSVLSAVKDKAAETA